jgi:hypothetical protein
MEPLLVRASACYLGKAVFQTLLLALFIATAFLQMLEASPVRLCIY